jgi:hypothetical protein
MTHERHGTLKQRVIFSMAIVLSGIMTLGVRAMKDESSSLPIEIDAEYRVTNMARENIASPIPDQNPIVQLSMILTRNEKEAYLFFWDGSPLRDFGPMKEQESWETTFLDGNAYVIRTTMFMGQQQEVLVLHSQFSEKGRLMIYSKDMSKEEFHEMLNAMQRKTN